MKFIISIILVFLLILPNVIGQTFTIDPAHTFINFSVNRFGAVDVSGRFNSFSGTITLEPSTQKITGAEISIVVKSIDTGHDVRDGHLKGEFWLEETKYPHITFTTSEIQDSGTGFLARGILDIHGVQNEIELPFTLTGPGIDPTKKNTLGISAEIVINRQDYGISFSKLMDNGKLFIGNEVSISINALAEEVN